MTATLRWLAGLVVACMALVAVDEVAAMEGWPAFAAGLALASALVTWAILEERSWREQRR